MNNQDEIIELVEIESVASSKNTYRSRKRSNKVSSPPEVPSTPEHRGSKNNYSLFQIKTNQQPKDVPIPPPRRRQRKNSDHVSGTDTLDSDLISEGILEQSSVSKSESKSYKERIRERFRSVKTKAGSSSHKASAFKNVTGKIIDQVRRESKDIDAELESARSRLNLNENIQSRQSLIDFFCKDIGKDEKEEDENNAEVVDLEQNVKDKTCVIFMKPQQLQTQFELTGGELLFVPSRKPLSVEDKLNTEPRCLEDEGLYVPKYPKMPKYYFNLLERRLLGIGDKKWFDCQGKMEILESPVRDIILRPQLPELSRKLTTIFLPALSEKHIEMEKVVVIKENILELKISTLRFSHHSLFSIEHVFEQKLKAAFEKYKKNRDTNHLQRLTNRLEALRQMKTNMKNILMQSGDHSQEEYEKINHYKKEIKSLRETLFTEGKKDRENVKAILENWRAIKKIRKVKGYSNTNTRLRIRREEVDYDAEKEKYDNDFEQTYKEIHFELKQDLKQKMKIHKKKLLGSGDEINVEESTESLTQTPMKISEEQIKRDLQLKFKESFKPPGEPILHFALMSDNEITKVVENNKENLRRSAVTSTKIHLKISCNKIEVCKSKPVFLNDQFTCSFLEDFSIQLTNIPKDISVEVIEHTSTLIKRKLGEIIVKVPSQNVSIDQSKYHEVAFEKNDIIHYKHEATGCGKTIKDLIEKHDFNVTYENCTLFTHGSLNCKIGWELKRSSQDKSDIAQVECKILDEIIDKNGGVDVQKLSEWMSCSNPDPQDPKNFILYEYAGENNDDVSIVSNKEKKFFRLNPYISKLQFCDISVIEDNLRFKILTLRDQNVPEFDGMTIPNRVKEIPPNLIRDYYRRLELDKEDYFPDDGDEFEIDRRRNQGNKYLKQIYIKVFQKCKTAQNNLTYEDVVDEKYLVHFEKFIKVLLSNLINWFRWQPKISQPIASLKKTVSESKSILTTNTSANILIKIRSGLNIPSRKKETFSEEIKNQSEGHQNHVHAYVEFTHKDFVARTETVSGNNPNWNEDIEIPLESTHTDYLNPNSLNGSILIRVFDEDQSENIDNVIARRRNLLGYLEIPLSAACHSSAMSGTFKIKMPYLLLGYEKEVDKLIMKSPKMPNIQVTSVHHTYLIMDISVNPIIPKLNPSMEELPSSDIPIITNHILKWNESYNNSYPSRRFSALAIDRNGKTTCVTRYIQPLEPPHINTEGFDVTAEQCARYVSLIPFTESNQFYQHVWLPTDCLLETMVGSIIDHAVALTCFLLALQLEVWLLLGFGIPYGSTAYVLMKEITQETLVFSIFDVVSGEKYNLTDAFCPLQRVYCVISDSNVFANTQRSDNVSLMRFDFTRRSDWLPLFDNNFPAPTNSIQRVLNYSKRVETEQLEILIDRKIRKCISKMRQLEPTIWCRLVSNYFKNVFYSFELNSMYGKSNYETLSDLQASLSVYNVNGFVISIPYVNVSSIIKKIKSLGIHNQKPNAEFASAVHVHSYINQVFVVWIFLAVVVPK